MISWSGFGTQTYQSSQKRSGGEGQKDAEGGSKIFIVTSQEDILGKTIAEVPNPITEISLGKIKVHNLEGTHLMDADKVA